MMMAAIKRKAFAVSFSTAEILLYSSLVGVDLTARRLLAVVVLC